MEVINTDLVVMPERNYLCGSPDGIVIEGGSIKKILEIKCPKTCAAKPVYDPKSKTFNVKYLEKINGLSKLKTNHIYYTQCQILMYVCGLSECDLFVWSPVNNGSELFSVLKDKNFCHRLFLK